MAATGTAVGSICLLYTSIGTAWTGENGDIPVAVNEKANTIPVGYVQSGT